jgi:hypothetical protein
VRCEENAAVFRMKCQGGLAIRQKLKGGLTTVFFIAEIKLNLGLIFGGPPSASLARIFTTQYV